MPEGRTWGSTSGVDIDPDGTSVRVAERCGAFAPPARYKPGQPFARDGSSLDPILKFDASGRLVKSFGAGMFILPHGLHVDHAGNIWVTDNLGRTGEGQQVIKFSSDGKVLMTLGKAGVAGSGPDEFNAPSAVYVAPSGDIFVADGHGGNTNARIVKFSQDGKFIKAWDTEGSAPGEFDVPHTLAMDSRGRLLLAIVKTIEFRFSIRMATFSVSGSSSAGRVGFISISTMSSTWLTQNLNRLPRITMVGNAAFASATSAP
jgi:DNA-binding beta-propeller fold protein YncE